MIKLNDTYYIDADDRCYTLCERKVKGENAKPEEIGKEYFAQLGYYSTAHGAINALVAMLCREAIRTTDMSIKEARDAFKAIQSDVDAWASNMTGGI